MHASVHFGACDRALVRRVDDVAEEDVVAVDCDVAAAVLNESIALIDIAEAIVQAHPKYPRGTDYVRSNGPRQRPGRHALTFRIAVCRIIA
ncbi:MULTISPECIES: hypothetical protein [unclassified Bradyrhizobium]|uniref:hypothetical protein n=1 Tax=unclassified Bradyrhizobium TaxID=2631580 RepID=UPI002479903A|nr:MULTISPECIES: hypothetical protein [unclassified Bradyrhizobium]WGR68024.1 hypothetical protein MTX24_21445 [Bradyrhizobium sp. ISRA426]WGR80078.1 hypothetical protein MTX21_06560 [Bradyrhizobium sp. ISRA430]WGR83263.1 hypothetical protein MTX25_21125 [Bradyrhizobium sp. ISRA432]